MIKRTVRSLLHIIGGLGAGLTIAVVLLVWRLSLGPISLGFLAPHVSDVLNDALPGVEASFEDTILVWAGWDRAVDVRIINLQFRTDENEVAAFIPEVAFALSATALSRGVIAAAELEFFDPTFTILRDETGHFGLGFSTEESGSLVDPKDLIAMVSGKGSEKKALHYLSRVRITNADVVVIDRLAGRSWATPDAQITLRRIDDGIALSSSFFVTLGDRVAEFLITANIDGESGRIDAGVSFDGLTPSILAGVAPEAAPLGRLNMPLEGLVTLDANLNGQLGNLRFDLTGGEGEVVLPPPIGTVVVASDIHLAGRFDTTIGRLSIQQLDASFAPGTVLPLPLDDGHLIPLSGLSFSGSYQGGEDRLRLDELRLDSGRVSFNAEGLIDGLQGRPAVSLSVSTTPLMVEDFPIYWPRSVAEDAYDWVIPQVTSGRVSELQVELEGGVEADGGFALDRLDGGFAFEDVSLTYIDAMPDVTGGTGVATFDQDQIVFDIRDASSFGLKSDRAQVRLYDLRTNIERAHIEVFATGPFRSAMELVDREPIMDPDEIGFDPSVASGTGEAELTFDFPLRVDLDWSHVKMAVLADVRNASIPAGLFGLDVEDAEFEIDIGDTGMDVIGDLRLAGYATNINWRQEFDELLPVRNTYTLNVWLDQVESLADLGVDTRPFSGDLMRGDMPLWLNVIENRDGEAVLSARGDLTGIEIDLSALEWRKKSGEAGEANVEVRLRDAQIVEIPSFRIKAPDLSIRGSASYAGEDLRLSRVDLEEVKVGRSDVKALLIPRGGGVWDADFQGAALDLAGIWDDIFEGDILESGDSLLPDMSVSAQFDRIWLSTDEHVDNMTSAFVRENAAWQTIYITTVVEGNEQLEIKLAPSDSTPATRLLTMWSRDAGSVLRLLRINDNMIGGEFNLVGRFEDSEPGEPLNGIMEITDFRVINAPTLTKVVSVMSLTGILESLTGEGLAFDRMKIPFRFSDGILEMKSAQANGPSLGFTANGKIYTHADVVDIEGTVVPAYLLNSILNNVPLLGSIFSGGEEGGGVFAARYAMTGSRDDPDVSVNALSAFTPGILRNVFSVFDGGTKTTDNGEAPTGAKGKQ